MKRTLIVAGLSALAAGSALAQSSVTVYGRANVTAEAIDRNGTKTKELVNNASRIGLKGTEDLGGGLKAGFQLEHGFSIDTGTPTQSAFWARRSEVNLGSNSFGMLRLGNYFSEAYFAIADYVSMHNHDTGTSSDALYAYLARNTNKIAYRAPEFVKGLSLEVAAALGEGQSRIRTYDFAANYQLGALALGAGYQKAGDANQFAIRALYEAGPFVFGAYVQRDENGFAATDATGNVVAATALGNRTNFRLSGMYALGASEFHLNFGSAGEYSKRSDSDATQITAAYNYNLSKRTKVYAYYTQVSDSSAKVYGGDFSSFALGLRHNF
ncbi:MAG: porin [Rubrivivax sp.]